VALWCPNGGWGGPTGRTGARSDATRGQAQRNDGLTRPGDVDKSAFAGDGP